MRDAGNMSGTGAPMLYVEGREGLDYGFHYFYVLGESADDYVDMYYGEGYGASSGSSDTCTLDTDGNSDFAIGMGGYQLPSGGANCGSIAFLHGSNRIPVKTRDIPHAVPQPNGPCLRYWANKVEIVTPDAYTPVKLAISDILGRPLFSADVFTDGEGRARIPYYARTRQLAFISATSSRSVLCTRAIL